jgi:hypothetical protein
MLTVLSSSIFMATPAQAAYGCGNAVGESHRDFQGWSWNIVWYCGNAAGAPMYAAANSNTHVAWMDSTWSWFVCYRRGAMHSGGNDVWYYSQGDRSVAGHASRSAWGFIPAANVWTTVDPHPEFPQCPADPPPAPARTNNLTKPVYFIHGYDSSMPTTISSYWGGMIGDFKTDGSPATLAAGNVVYYCYYSKLTGCTAKFAGETSTPLYEVGRRLAWDIFDRHSKFGRSVDLIGHSMGGLVAKAAVTGVRLKDPAFPPYLYVEDGVTISTPNAGLTGGAAAVCMFVETTQCSDMRSVNWFMSWVIDAPASTIHTDWTFIGSDDDPVILSNTSVPAAMWVGHKVQYDSGQIIPQATAHMGILSATTGTYSYIRCNLDTQRATDPYCQNKSTFTRYSAGFDPSKMARVAIYYKDLY